jgi:hypothetical protein
MSEIPVRQGRYAPVAMLGASHPSSTACALQLQEQEFVMTHYAFFIVDQTVLAAPPFKHCIRSLSVR